MTQKNTGVQEWAEKSVNIQYGCEHNCRYCYARKMAARFNRIPAEGWDHPIKKQHFWNTSLPRNTQVMFPSTHDITPNNLDMSIGVILSLLNRNNKVLIVSKPHLKCIKKILDFCGPREQIEFRFSIGSQNDEVLKYWEPNAPRYKERMECIKETSEHGFITSVSCEPLLDNINHGDYTHYFGIPLIEELILLNGVYPIKEIWIGAIQYMKGPELDYKAIYECYKTNPRIRFKDSFLKQAKHHGVVLE